jgi:hypothetical protein
LSELFIGTHNDGRGLFQSIFYLIIAPQNKFLPKFMEEKIKEIHSTLADVRNTLFWSPSVITDENGEASITFYCSDINTGFTGRIEGVGDAGLLGVSAFDFRVLRCRQ